LYAKRAFFLAGVVENPYFRWNEVASGPSKRQVRGMSDMRTLKDRWSGRGIVAAGFTAMMTGLAYGQESAGELADHATGSSYLSWGLFVLIGLIAVFLVFKGTRSK
jgi:hypothetical protein